MDKISNAITCFNCNSILNSPVLLSCGHSICKLHVPDASPNNRIGCVKCGRIHAVPKEGFPENESLAEIIAVQVHKISLGVKHEKAKQNNKTFESLINEIDKFLADPTYFTNEEIDTIKNSILLKREELKLKIDQETEKFLNEIDEYVELTKNLVNKKEFKLLNEQNKLAKANFNKIKKEFNQIKVDDVFWQKISHQIESELKILAQNLENFKQSFILDGLNELKGQSNFFRILDIDFNYISRLDQF